MARTASALATAAALGLLLGALAAPTARADACGPDVRVDLPACFTWSAETHSSRFEVTLVNNCPNRVAYKVDISGGPDATGFLPGGWGSYEHEISRVAWHKIRDVKCCPEGNQDSDWGDCDQSETVQEIAAREAAAQARAAFETSCREAWGASPAGALCTLESLAANDAGDRCVLKSPKCDETSAGREYVLYPMTLTRTLAEVESARVCESDADAIALGYGLSFVTECALPRGQDERQTFLEQCEYAWTNSEARESCSAEILTVNEAIDKCQLGKITCWWGYTVYQHGAMYRFTPAEVRNARLCEDTSNAVYDDSRLSFVPICPEDDHAGKAAEAKAARDAFLEQCRAAWQDTSEIGEVCTYSMLDVDEDNTRCLLDGVRCADLRDDPSDPTWVDNGDLSLTVAQIGTARNCASEGTLVASGDCSYIEDQRTDLTPVQATFDGLCAWKWNDSNTGCTWESMAADYATYQCSFTNITCATSIGVDTHTTSGTFSFDVTDTWAARGCDNGTFAADGDCSLHDDEEEDEPGNVLTLEQRRKALLAECNTAGEQALAQCRPASMEADETATYCIVGEPIVCTDGEGNDIPNWPGKIEWTPAEIRNAEVCDGELRLDGCDSG